MFDVSCRICRKTYTNLADALKCAQSHKPKKD